MVNLDEIIFAEKTFKIEETRKGTDRLKVEQIETYGITDPNRYKKDKLLFMCKNFIQKYDFMKF